MATQVAAPDVRDECEPRSLDLRPHVGEEVNRRRGVGAGGVVPPKPLPMMEIVGRSAHRIVGHHAIPSALRERIDHVNRPTVLVAAVADVHPPMTLVPSPFDPPSIRVTEEPAGAVLACPAVPDPRREQGVVDTVPAGIAPR